MFTAAAIEPGDEVNKSTNFMGINNMWIESSETGIDFDLRNPSFDVDVRVNFSGGGDRNRVIEWVAYGVDDTTIIGTGTHDGNVDGTLVHAEGSHFIGKLSLRSTDKTTSWQIGEIILGSTLGKDPVTVSYDATIADADGDEAQIQMDFEQITSQY